MPVGTVTAFDRRKGSGLITPDDGGPDVPVHVSVVERAGLTHLDVGAKVRYAIQTDKARNTSVATNLSLA